LISGEIDSLQAQIAQSVQKEYDSKQKLQELEAINNERSARIAGLEEKSTQHDQDRRSLTAQLMDLRVELGQITEQAKALRQMIEALQNQIQANLRDAELAEQEMQNCDRQIAAAQGDILSCEATVSELYLEKDKSQQNNKLLHSEIQTLLERQKQTEQLARLKRSQSRARPVGRQATRLSRASTSGTSDRPSRGLQNLQ
jgi:chromosome segregation ATPase